MTKKIFILPLLILIFVSCGGKKATQQDIPTTETDSLQIEVIPDSNVVVIDTIQPI